MKNISLEIEVKHEVTKEEIVAGERRTYTKYEGTGDWQYADLSGAELTLEVVGVIMSDEKGGTYSYPFTLDVEENELIFGSSGELRGESIYNRLHGARCKLIGGGLPIMQGKIDLDTSVDIKTKKNGHHSVELKVVSRNKSYEEKIEGAKLRDLDLLKYKIQIGYSLPKELYFRYTFTRVTQKYTGRYEDWNDNMLHYTGTGAPGYVPPFTAPVTEVISKQDRYVSLPHCMLPKYNDTIYHGTYSGNFVNVSEPYDPNNPTAHPYCNTRICYQKYKESDKDDKKDEVQWEKERGYSIGEADRINSAPCFYLGFVFDAAMEQMGIPVTDNALNMIMDYKRMAFWHADAQYKLVPASERGAGFDFDGNPSFKAEAYYKSGQQYSGNNIYKFEFNREIYRYAYTFKDENGKDSRKITPMFTLHRAYANADNLPDLEVKDLIENLTAAFGAKVIYDEYLGSISIILLRDVMRDSENAIDVPCEIIENYKTENDNRGFVLKYSGANAQSFNSITKAKNDSQGSDETQYNYYGYKNIVMLQQGSAYPSFQNLMFGASCYDMNLYIDSVTGNMFRIKVDGGAENQGSWYPSTFEVAGYRDVELGDCTENEYVKTVSIPFAPAIASITNQTEMRKAAQVGSDIPSPIYAQFVDGEIHNNGELIDHVYDFDAIPLDTITDDTGRTVTSCHMDVSVKITSFEEYTGSDAPYYDNECENVIGIMRGSGSGESLIYYDNNYDGFGTEKYTKTAGSDSEFFSDSVNHFGEMFDYNGGGETIVTREMAKPLIRSYFGNGKRDYTTYYNAELRVAYNINHKAWCLFETNTSDIIGKYTSEQVANEYMNILIELRKLIFTTATEVTVKFPDNGLGYLPSDALSLKLKAEKPVEGDKDKGYYPVSDTFAKRGLWDKYYVDWANFWLNYHIANLTVRMELSSLVGIIHDTTKWYKFGEYTGLIKSGTARLKEDGSVELEVKLAYL